MKSKRNTLAIPLLALSAAAFSMQLLAEEIAIPIGQQASAKSIVAPHSGIKQAAVLSKFGQPLDRSGSVGSPPISRWEYRDFFVYFEYDKVIHTVRKH